MLGSCSTQMCIWRVSDVGQGGEHALMKDRNPDLKTQRRRKSISKKIKVFHLAEKRQLSSAYNEFDYNEQPVTAKIADGNVTKFCFHKNKLQWAISFASFYSLEGIPCRMSSKHNRKRRNLLSVMFANLLCNFIFLTRRGNDFFPCCYITTPKVSY